ncbi:MAG: histidine phosphatase family protein [Clostridiales bacterium]|nr:histidine phosphatase family protein [Clostridiales bacterium]MCD7887422.1 histidine phosphatase family protein [Clostridiales bacterium]
MKLYVTRHGETAWNRRDVVCGRTDLPLTERGLAQAEELAERAAQTDIDLILTSPLLRARQTAQAVARRIGAEVIVEPLLIEQDFGVFEEGSRFDPDYQDYRQNFFRRFPGGGESVVMVASRGYTLLRALPERYPGKTPLLVSHGAFCRALHTWFADTPNEAFSRFRLENCQLQEYELL